MTIASHILLQVPLTAVVACNQEPGPKECITSAPLLLPCPCWKALFVALTMILSLLPGSPKAHLALFRTNYAQRLRSPLPIIYLIRFTVGIIIYNNNIS